MPETKKPKTETKAKPKAKAKTQAEIKTQAKVNTKSKAKVNVEANDESVTFQIKRSQLTVAVALIAFVAGLGLGYLQWGAGGEQVAVVPQAGSSGSDNVSLAGESDLEELSIAEQIEAIDRFDISIDGSDPSFGPEDALVTIVEFSDFECPFCKRHFEITYPRIIEEYEGQIRYVFKDLPISSIHPNAIPAAIAAQCAFEQNAFWPFHDLLFGGSLDLSRSSYEAYALQLGLDIDEFLLCLVEDRYLNVVQADLDYARQIGVNSTPTLFVNGIGVVGAQPYEVFAQIIDHELGLAD
jgi:protein-disulfide isomerase